MFTDTYIYTIHTGIYKKLERKWGKKRKRCNKSKNIQGFLAISYFLIQEGKHALIRTLAPDSATTSGTLLLYRKS